MPMRFAYQLVRMPRSVPSLGGRWVRPRTLVSVGLVGPAQTNVLDALLDTGADDTVFPTAVAAKIGVDLTKAPVGEASGVASSPVAVRYALLQLRLTDGKEFREWPTWVGFTAAPLKMPLLGFAGCLQFFAATFREDVELDVNALCPGT
jgi:hypothetical protein